MKNEFTMNYYFKVLQNYANFDGRARRSEYWYFMLFTTLISIGLAFVSEIMGITFLNPLYSCAVLLPNIAVAVRRMHDVDKSGWFAIVPIYNLILVLSEGTRGDNGYGEDPKAITSIYDEGNHMV